MDSRGNLAVEIRSTLKEPADCAGRMLLHGRPIKAFLTLGGQLELFSALATHAAVWR